MTSVKENNSVPPNPSATTRRGFLQHFSAWGAAITTASTVCSQEDVYDFLLASSERGRLIGRFLERDERRKFYLALEGHIPVVRMHFSPVETSGLTKNDLESRKIPVYRKPTLSRGISEKVFATDIKALHGVRVFGEKHQDIFGGITIEHDGKTYEGGIWIAFTTEKGDSFLTARGALTNEPSYITPSYATVLPEQEQPTTEDQLREIADFYYRGKILITKNATVRREAKISYPADENVVSWDNIIWVNGIDVTRHDRVVLTNPLSTFEGDNPTYNKGLSAWLVVGAIFIDSINGVKEVRTKPLFINVSPQTSTVVIPERPLSESDFVPLIKKRAE